MTADFSDDSIGDSTYDDDFFEDDSDLETIPNNKIHASTYTQTNNQQSSYIQTSPITMIDSDTQTIDIDLTSNSTQTFIKLHTTTTQTITVKTKDASTQTDNLPSLSSTLLTYTASYLPYLMNLWKITHGLEI